MPGLGGGGGLLGIGSRNWGLGLRGLIGLGGVATRVRESSMLFLPHSCKTGMLPLAVQHVSFAVLLMYPLLLQVLRGHFYLS